MHPRNTDAAAHVEHTPIYISASLLASISQSSRQRLSRSGPHHTRVKGLVPATMYECADVCLHGHVHMDTACQMSLLARRPSGNPHETRQLHRLAPCQVRPDHLERGLRRDRKLQLPQHLRGTAKEREVAQCFCVFSKMR